MGGAPPPLPSLAFAGLLDQPDRRQLSQVVAGGSGVGAEDLSQSGGGCRPVEPELAEKTAAQRMGQHLQRIRIKPWIGGRGRQACTIVVQRKCASPTTGT